MYKVIIHEHVIYERFISAPSMQLAIEATEEEVVSEDKGKWRQDYNAGWTDVIEAEVIEDEEPYA